MSHYNEGTSISIEDGWPPVRFAVNSPRAYRLYSARSFLHPLRSSNRPLFLTLLKADLLKMTKACINHPKTEDPEILYNKNRSAEALLPYKWKKLT